MSSDKNVKLHKVDNLAELQSQGAAEANAAGDGVEEDQITVVELTEEEYVQEMNRRARIEVSQGLLIDTLRTLTVSVTDKRNSVIEVIKSNGEMILAVDYVLRGAEYKLPANDLALAHVTVDGDVTVHIPPKHPATLWRAGSGASIVKLNGGPHGCIQKLNPGEVLEVKQSQSVRWLVRQVPPQAALQPERAPDPVATFHNDNFWDEHSSTEASL